MKVDFQKEEKGALKKLADSKVESKKRWNELNATKLVLKDQEDMSRQTHKMLHKAGVADTYEKVCHLNSM